MHVEADVTTEKEQRKGSFVYFSYYLESENAFSDCSEMGGTFDGGGGGVLCRDQEMEQKDGDGWNC